MEAPSCLSHLSSFCQVPRTSDVSCTVINEICRSRSWGPPASLPQPFRPLALPLFSVTMWRDRRRRFTRREGYHQRNEMTELLKGTLEGIVLTVLFGATPPMVRWQVAAPRAGLTDIAEGTVYALLVRIEQRGLVDVERNHQRKSARQAQVYALNARGHEYLEESGKGAVSRSTSSNSSTKKGKAMMKVAQLDRMYQKKAPLPRILPAGARMSFRRTTETAIDTLERYMEYFGPGKAGSLLPML